MSSNEVSSLAADEPSFIKTPFPKPQSEGRDERDEMDCKTMISPANRQVERMVDVIVILETKLWDIYDDFIQQLCIYKQAMQDGN